MTWREEKVKSLFSFGFIFLENAKFRATT